jgi:steroid 5-alpha reductase family enzyme
MTVPVTLLLGWLASSLLMTAVWLVQRARGKAAIVDVAWSFATAVLGICFAAVAAGLLSRRVLVAAMVGVWGVRLGLHLLHRVRREPEDGRYDQMRRDWGRAAERRLCVGRDVRAPNAGCGLQPRAARVVGCGGLRDLVRLGGG